MNMSSGVWIQNFVTVCKVSDNNNNKYRGRAHHGIGHLVILQRYRWPGSVLLKRHFIGINNIVAGHPGPASVSGARFARPVLFYHAW